MGLFEWIGVAILVVGLLLMGGYFLVGFARTTTGRKVPTDPLDDATMRLQRMVVDAEALAVQIGENAGNAAKQEALKLYSSIVLKPKSTKPTT